jgi:glutaminyl-tRNA synthetase
VIKDESGNIVELRCTYDPATRGGDSADGRSPKGTLHWVSVEHAIPRKSVYMTACSKKSGPTRTNVVDALNPNSLEILKGCQVEPSLKTARTGDRFQLERQGYFCVDPDSEKGILALNRTVTLRDTWAKIEKKPGS